MGRDVGQRKFLRVGLTGGIASGKSSVARLFSEAGVPVLDADALVRELSAPGGKAHGAILARFGTTDRDQLRSKIYADPSARQALEAILHPLVAQESAAKIRDFELQGKPGVIYEAALLIEAGRAKDFDEVVVVVAPEETRLSRLVSRDSFTREQAKAILAAQLSDAERLKFATEVIQNDQGFDELKTQVADLVRRWFA